MVLGTIDRAPPPFFRQGPSALTKLVVCAALSAFLMVADRRFAFTPPLRAVLATVLYYPEQVLLVPVRLGEQASDYLAGLGRAVAAEDDARRRLAAQAVKIARLEQLSTENLHLRRLLDLAPALGVRARAAQVQYEASDPYSRRLVIDQGAGAGVVTASPVINEAGVLGQVTRVYPFSSEVTLLVDKEAAIPVLNARTQARSVVFGSASMAGSGSGGMEMRFMASNADVRVGDALTTSGVDGVYPPGLPVAEVVSIERKVDSGFARILLAPKSRPEGVRHVMVLEPVGRQLPPREVPEVEDPAASSPRKAGRRVEGPR